MSRVPESVIYAGLISLYGEICAEIERLQAIPVESWTRADMVAFPHLKRAKERYAALLDNHPLHQPARAKNHKRGMLG